METIQTLSFDVISFDNAESFLWQDNAIPLLLELLRE